MNADLLKSLGIIGGGVIATVTPYIVTWAKKKLYKNEEANSFIHNTEYRVQINEVLVEIRAIVGANRVCIVEYHNGNAAINGLPFNYASMTYEKDDLNTREMMMNFQKVPISPTCELLLDVHNSDQGYVRVGKDYRHKDVIEFHRYYGIESAYIFRIGDHIKFGTVQLMWIGDDVTLDPEEVEEVHYKIMYINELMKKMKKH
jgi:hypothetical protein